MGSENQLLIKVVLVGDSGVGKTALLKRFVHKTFPSTFSSTIGVDFEIIERQVRGFNCQVQLWDTAGQERFRTITSSHYKGANAVLLVYDVTDAQSFANVQQWLAEIYKHRADAEFELLLVGNKVDDETHRTVSFAEGVKLQTQQQCEFIETSAKEGTNVEEAFEELLQKAVERIGLTPVDQRRTVATANSSGQEEGQTFCC